MRSSVPLAAGRIRSWPIAVLIALAPLWLVGILDRGLWTPDEPREADISWRMSQALGAVPQLAGKPFLEKPPLSYWLSAAGVAAFGQPRVPNILYASVTALAVGATAAAMADASAAFLGALLAATTLIAFRVSVWLAPDASLLAGCAIALLGAYKGYTAPAGSSKLGGYTLMHLGAAIGFMAKSAPGWLVPALALLTLIAWERKWSELLRIELYAGLLLQALIIGPWAYSVAHSPDGHDALRAILEQHGRSLRQGRRPRGTRLHHRASQLDRQVLFRAAGVRPPVDAAGHSRSEARRVRRSSPRHCRDAVAVRDRSDSTLPRDPLACSNGSRRLCSPCNAGDEPPHCLVG